MERKSTRGGFLFKAQLKHSLKPILKIGKWILTFPMGDFLTIYVDLNYLNARLRLAKVTFLLLIFLLLDIGVHLKTVLCTTFFKNAIVMSFSLFVKRILMLILPYKHYIFYFCILRVVRKIVIAEKQITVIVTTAPVTSARKPD